MLCDLERTQQTDRCGWVQKAMKISIIPYGIVRDDGDRFPDDILTMMVASGVDIKTAQALMGHATPKMMLKIYAKQEKSRIADAIEKVSGFRTTQ